MFVVMNVVEAKEGRVEDFERAFRERERLLNQAEGFVEFELLRRDRDREYVVLTKWESDEAFKAWVGSDLFKRSHRHRRRPVRPRQRDPPLRRPRRRGGGVRRAFSSRCCSVPSPLPASAPGGAADRRPDPVRRQHPGQARGRAGGGRPDARRPRTDLAEAEGRPGAAALAPQRAQPRAARLARTRRRPLLADLGQRQRVDGRPRDRGDDPRAAPGPRLLLADAGDRQAGRQGEGGRGAGREHEEAGGAVAARRSIRTRG